MESLRMIDTWPVDRAAAAVVTRDGGMRGEHGRVDEPFRLASVTKLLTAYAVLAAVEEGAVEPDDEAGPPGSTIRHLQAHTSGLAFDDDRVLAAPGRKRIYSNTGFEVLAAAVEKACDIPFEDYVREAVFEPLGMSETTLGGSPAAGGISTVRDLTRFAAELMAPRLLAPETVREATSVVFPGLDGVLPGYGAQRPNDWGLGFEIKGTKSPHWTGAGNSPATYGHFGARGTFLWVDPALGAAAVCLTDRDFGPWAAEVWPGFNDAVVAELG
ncbi:serine hydrolase domain-containing protein [Streptomyces sp. SID3343]|uniref:serine hydrolase n=1 Tax=Streptomyces sp. SID3343 TaxID=2690260 RepID=UPI00136DD952|nr:serine hydrolase [Streptomyces sp. SID3343]